MEMLKLVVVFAGIMIFIRKPLWFAISVGVVIAVLIFRIPFFTSLSLAKKAVTSWDTVSLVLAFYTITFVQRMMESRKMIKTAEVAVDNLFNSKRITCMLTPFVIGLLPAAGAVLIAAPIVENAAGDNLSVPEKTFVTSYFRHISEAFMPTYSGILLALQLSKVDMTKFVLGMLPMMACLFALGYIFYIRKIPKIETAPKKSDKGEDVKNFCLGLWPIIVTIIIVLTTHIAVYKAVIPVIVVLAFTRKFSLKEILPFFRTAFESKQIVNTIIIMIFKELLTYTGIIGRMPGYFSKLPVPTVVIFGIIFLVVPIVSGSQATIALALPLAYAAMPNGGLPLMIFLMCLVYIAMQMSPTHVCLAIVVERFKVSFIDLVRKTVPVALSFIAICSVYSYLLYFIG
ncbi:MAG: DUF401 family protein [Fusobacteriaceae bacterium]|jgi:integral membrane protein (TIGR00529 family)|nr:DUF401 family protein [Fusobacteriaceae bacterium]